MKTAEYGFMEGATLHSRFLSEYREVIQEKDGTQSVRIVTVEEQAAALSREWKPVDPIYEDMMDSGDPDYIITLQPYDAGDHIAYNYVKKFDVQRVRDEIASLKEALTGSDYKISKCYEASLTGEPLPYDILALHAERQAQRARINYLEGLSLIHI